MRIHDGVGETDAQIKVAMILMADVVGSFGSGYISIRVPLLLMGPDLDSRTTIGT